MPATDAAAPNIIFIFADQHRHDALGCAGNALIETPNLDALAAAGTRFSQTWCQSPVCQPSRASMITGQYPHQLGVLKNFGPDLDSGRPTFMQHLQAAGYATANIGKTHYYAEGLVTPDENDGDLRRYESFVEAFGFDHVVEEFDRYVHAMDGVQTPYTEYLRAEGAYEAYCEQIKSVWRLTENHWNGVTSVLDKEQDLTSFLSRAAQSWLAQQSADKPFFLQLSYVQPHVPLMGDPQWAEYYANLEIPRQINSTGDGEAPEVWREYLGFCRHHSNSHLLSDEYVLAGARQYYAMISLLDECVGNIVSQLRRDKLLDNTLIVYSSDHGELLGDHNLMAKLNFYRGSVQIPLIIKPPAGTAEVTGIVNDELVELVDLATTFVDYAGAAPLADAGGHSLRALVEGQVQRRTSQQPRDHQFSEIQKHGRGEHVPTYRSVRNQRYRFTLETVSDTPCELFDLQEDPQELHNLVAQPAAADLVGEMAARVRQRVA